MRFFLQVKGSSFTDFIAAKTTWVFSTRNHHWILRVSIDISCYKIFNEPNKSMSYIWSQGQKMGKNVIHWQIKSRMFSLKTCDPHGRTGSHILSLISASFKEVRIAWYMPHCWRDLKYFPIDTWIVYCFFKSLIRYTRSPTIEERPRFTKSRNRSFFRSRRNPYLKKEKGEVYMCPIPSLVWEKRRCGNGAMTPIDSDPDEASYLYPIALIRFGMAHLRSFQRHPNT